MEDAYLFLKTDDALITYSLDAPGATPSHFTHPHTSHTLTLHTPSHFTHPHTSHTLTLHTPSHFTHPHTLTGITPLGDNPPPKYAFDVKLGKNTVVNYSSYGNRQRNQMQKIFFPNDFTEKPYTKLPDPGQRRIHTMFNVFIEATSPLTAYHLFSDRHDNIAHLAIAIGTGSKLSLHQPWVYARDGQLSVVKGNLHCVRITSSLDYQVINRVSRWIISSSTCWTLWGHNLTIQ